jgi:hypothetical protein
VAGQVGTPSLDVERADLNRLTVRALATRVLALAGVAFVAFQAWGYLAWAAHGGSRRFEVAGPVPAAAHHGVLLGEILMPLVTLGWLAFVLRGVLRARSLTWPLALTAVWGLTYWQESLANLTGPRFAYNADFVDRGDWTASLPFVHVSGPGLAQPLLMEPAVFLGLLPLISWLVAAGIGRLRRTGLGLLPAAALVYLAVLALEFGAEMRSIAQGVHAYPVVYGALSIRTGHADQFPLYENWLLALMWFLPGLVASGSLRRSRSDRLEGRSDRLEGRSDRLEGRSDRLEGRSAVTLLLAGVGALNLAFLLYNLIAFVWLPADTYAVQPPWLTP